MASGRDVRPDPNDLRSQGYRTEMVAVRATSHWRVRVRHTFAVMPLRPGGKVLVPDRPVFNVPNRITDTTWKDWVQERGLYFLGEKDARYVDLVQMADSFPDNPGMSLGSFVEAKTGKGRWLYLGLGLWRQVPAETEGAYQLLANLISLPRAPAAPVATKPAAPVKK